jgi:hypothetical protein
MASTRLTRTSSGTITNNKKFTISFWMKRSIISTGQETVFGSYPSGTSNDYVYFPSGDQLGFFGSISGSQSVYLLTTRVFRDVSAWSHIVIAVDTTQSTESDRVKIYVNGVQETAFDQSSYPAQNVEFRLAKASNTQEIGAINSGNYFDGLLTHFNFIDGTQYQASDFGESDSVSGIWKPKTSPNVTYGSNGFFLKFENSAAMGTDSSGNSNTFTVSGSLTQNVDSPTNNFFTLNPLDAYYTNSTFSNGNLTFASGSSYSGTLANILLDTGKWYWEVKPISKAGDTDNYVIGIQGAPSTATNQFAGYHISHGYQYYGQSGQIWSNGSGAAYGNTYTAGDIIGVALDLDNNKLYFSKNGTFQNSGVPTSGSTGTGAQSITAPGSVTLGGYYPSQSFWSSSSATLSMNFGSGFFGTTAVASANADGNGFGAFEYAVPSGYYALCTKNIKEFG